MSERQLAKAIRIVFFIALFATLLGANVALAQSGRISNLRATVVSTTSITIKWEAVDWGPNIEVYFGESEKKKLKLIGSTTGNTYRIKRLTPYTKYRIRVSYFDFRELVDYTGTITVRTKARSKDPDADVTVASPTTCPHLAPAVIVSGHSMLTQCRIVDQSAIGRTDIIERDVIAAVDIWSEVPSGVEVCFQNAGTLVFLDAAYTPRMLTPLLSFVRNGMTCGQIGRAGTVVLLREPMQLDQPIVPANPAPAPSVELAGTVGSAPIPLDNCLIKLVETLYLRAEPAGEIIGLVWMNSEVPAFEINGYWYKVEFEGKTGYISRYFREVVYGACG